MVTLEMSVEEAMVLLEQLAHRITELDRDVVRTEPHDLRHALVEDVEHLNDVERRLAALLHRAGT